MRLWNTWIRTGAPSAPTVEHCSHLPIQRKRYPIQHMTVTSSVPWCLISRCYVRLVGGLLERFGWLMIRFLTGRQLAVASRAGPIWAYDEADWSVQQFEIPRRKTRATALAFSPRGRHIVIAYEDGTVGFHDARDGTMRDISIQVGSISRALVFCESGRVLAIGTDTGEIHLYDIVRRRVRTVVKGHTGRINALAVLPNGTTLISGGRDANLRLWDTVSGEQLTSIAGHRRMVFSIAAAADGQVVVSGGIEGDIRFWCAQSGDK